MKSIPRRSFKVDIDGEVFVASELSVAYIKSAMDNGIDNSEVAIFDAIVGFSESDYKRFGAETENKLYSMIVDFTFDPTLTTNEEKKIAIEFNMKFEEFVRLDRDTKLILKGIMESRKPKDPEQEKVRKKILPS